MSLKSDFGETNINSKKFQFNFSIKNRFCILTKKNYLPMCQVIKNGLSKKEDKNQTYNNLRL